MPIQFPPSFWQNCWSFQRGVQDDLKCTILAAGLGRRMDPLTINHLPKPMFPLGGKLPMAEVWVRRLMNGGITDISMNLCVLKETIKDHFGDGTKFGARISYVEEETPGGTLGGICKQVLGREARQIGAEPPPAVAAFRGTTVIAPSGDIVTNFGSGLLEVMYDIHQRAGAALTMVLVPVPWERRKDFGTVLLRNPEERQGVISKSGQIDNFFEKDANSPSNLNNASIYLIETDLIRELDRFRTAASLDVAEPFYDFGKHVFPAMLGHLPYRSLSKEYLLWGVQYDGNWFDVGQKRDYLRVNEQLLDGKLNLSLPYEQVPWGYIGTGVAIDFAKVTIVPPVVIGNNCIIESDVTLGPYAVLGDGWVVEKGASIRHAVLWERYAFHREDGSKIPAQDRIHVDRHQIRRGVAIEESILVGGTIEKDVREQTVDVSEEGQVTFLPIDYVPAGPRA